MTFTSKLNRTATAIALGLALGMSPAMYATAQETGTTAAPAPSYDDATLESFVTAAMEVSAVREDYTAQLQTATSEEAAQALVEDANDAMLAAVDAVEGMDVDTYVAIGEAAQQDEQLAARITEIVEGRRSDG
jgi:hypothetical protein